MCFILCFALLCFYVSLHYVLPALQFNCACLIVMHMYAVILKSARDSPGTGNNARRIGILFKSNFCRNYNM